MGSTINKHVVYMHHLSIRQDEIACPRANSVIHSVWFLSLSPSSLDPDLDCRPNFMRDIYKLIRSDFLSHLFAMMMEMLCSGDQKVLGDEMEIENGKADEKIRDCTRR